MSFTKPTKSEFFASIMGQNWPFFGIIFNSKTPKNVQTAGETPKNDEKIILLTKNPLVVHLLHTSKSFLTWFCLQDSLKNLCPHLGFEHKSKIPNV